VELPLNLVIALEHAGFDVGSHEPVVTARIEVVRVVFDQLVVFYLVSSPGCPLVHQLAQVEVVVDGIVVELFLLDLVNFVSEAKVEPVNDVQHLNGLREKLVVNLRALNNVQSENVL